MKSQRFIIFIFIFLFVIGGLPFQPIETVQADDCNNKSVKESFEDKEGDCSPPPSQSSTQAEDSTSQVGISVGDVIQMIFSTLLVIGLLLFVLKWIQKKGRNFSAHGVIENIGGSSLGNQKSIQLVKVGNRVYIVGVGESITLLKEIENEEEIAELIDSKPSLPQASFNRWGNLLQGKKPEDPTSFFNSLKNELNKMKKDRKQAISDWNKKKESNHNE